VTAADIGITARQDGTTQRMTHPRTDLLRDAALRKQLHKGFAWLHFDGDIERAFRAHFADRQLVPGRLIVGLASVIFAIFAAHDLLVYPSPFGGLAFLIQALFIAPALIGVLVASYIEPLPRRIGGLAWVALIAASVGLLTIIVQAYRHGIDYPYHGLLLILMAAYFVTAIRFYQASAFGVGVMAAYLAGTIATGQPPALIVEGTLYLGSANILGMMANYATEHAERFSYLSSEILRSEANRDGLTGLHNRRFLEEQLPRLWRHAQRDRARLGFALVDVDYFKTYNDVYGHLAGDDCLKAIADALRGEARRPLDMVVRYGGEEFLLVWYGLEPPEIVSEMADNARRAVENLRLPHAASAVSPHVTVSAGAVSAVPGTDKSPERAIENADAALYEAKAHGRNRVVTVDERLPARTSAN